MRTTLDIAERVLRWCEPRSIGKLETDQKMELADAIGYGLAEFYEHAPATKRTANSVIPICAPKDVTITVEKGSVFVEGYEFDPKHIGCSIGFQTDNQTTADTINEIATPNMLMRPWEGASGEVAIKIYHDAFGFGSSVRRLLTDPLLNYKGSLSRRLCRAQWDEAIEESRYFGGGSGWYESLHHRHSTFHRGEPTHFAIYEPGNSQNSHWEFILKIHPSPTRVMSMTVNVDFDPEMPCWEALANFPTELPITPKEFTYVLLPLVEARVADTTMWVGDENVTGSIKQKRIEALQSIRKTVIDRAPRKHKRLGIAKGW